MSRVQACLNTLPWREIALLRRILYTHFFTLKNPSALHNLRYLIEHKHLTTEGFAAQTLQQPVTNYTPPFCLPYPSASIARRIFFALPVIIFTAWHFSLSAQKKFVTNLLTCITKFVTRITNFVTSVTNFVTKTFLYDRKNYPADSENYLADNKNYLADSGTWNLPHTRVQNKMFVERRSTWPENSQPISGQDNPSLMTGLRRKPYTRNQI